MYDIQKNRYKSWEEIGMPDIVFHLNPHYKAFAESSNICNFPLSILNVYIPYGIMIYGNVRQQYNQLSHMLYWKIFCETPLHKKKKKKILTPVCRRKEKYGKYLRGQMKKK